MAIPRALRHVTVVASVMTALLASAIACADRVVGPDAKADGVVGTEAKSGIGRRPPNSVTKYSYSCELLYMALPGIAWVKVA